MTIYLIQLWWVHGAGHAPGARVGQAGGGAQARGKFHHRTVVRVDTTPGRGQGGPSINLNNKRLMQGYISSMCVCLSALFLRNGATFEYGLCTAYWCGNSNDNQAFILKFC